MEETIDTGMSDCSTGITTATKRAFQKAAKWSSFLAVVGFIGVGLMVLGAVSMMVFGSAMSEFSQTAGFPSGVFGVIYLLVGGLYFIPILRLMRFANYTKAWLSSDSSSDLESGIQNLAGMFTFIGVLTAIILSLYALVIVGMFAFGMGM